MEGLPTPTTKDALADWVEFRVLFGAPTLSRAEIRDSLDEDATLDDLAEYDQAGEGDLGPQGVLDADGVSEIDVLVDEVLMEIETRRTIGGVGYPAEVQGTVVAREPAHWAERAGYALMTCLNARYLFGVGAPVEAGARLFERLSAFALDGYWSGTARHFGWPRDGAETAAFEDATRHLAKAMGERVIRDIGEFPTQQKDAGLDAVTWRHLDKRRGNSILLCQCAIGDKWDEKGVIVELWRKFLSFAVPPTTALAFPFVPESVRTQVDWELLCAKIGIPLDRLRLAALLADRTLPQELHDEVETYVGDVLAGVQAGPGGQ